MPPPCPPTPAAAGAGTRGHFGGGPVERQRRPHRPAQIRSRSAPGHLPRSQRPFPDPNPPKTGPRTPPGVQTHQFLELRPAVATRRAPEGHKTSNPEPPGSRIEARGFLAFGSPSRRDCWTRLEHLVRLDPGRGLGTDFEPIRRRTEGGRGRGEGLLEAGGPLRSPPRAPRKPSEGF